MSTSRSLVSLTCFLLIQLLKLCLVSNFVIANTSLGQKEKIIRRGESKSGLAVLEIGEYTPIPEATELCTAEESAWWNQVRKAGNDLQKKSDEKTKRRFYLLLYEGQQKGYRIPLKDRPQQILAIRMPRSTEKAGRNHITGTVEYSIEFRSDASIGEIKIIKGLGFGIDENVIQAAHELVFLPAIKDGAFVTRWSDSRIIFSDKWTKKAKSEN